MGHDATILIGSLKGDAASESGPRDPLVSPLKTAEDTATPAIAPAHGPFPMQGGPSIPWATAEIIHRAYARLYPGQSLERMAERHGFHWDEVSVIFKDLYRRDPDLWKELMNASHQPR